MTRTRQWSRADGTEIQEAVNPKKSCADVVVSSRSAGSKRAFLARVTLLTHHTRSHGQRRPHNDARPVADIEHHRWVCKETLRPRPPPRASTSAAPTPRARHREAKLVGARWRSPVEEKNEGETMEERAGSMTRREQKGRSRKPHKVRPGVHSAVSHLPHAPTRHRRAAFILSSAGTTSSFPRACRAPPPAAVTSAKKRVPVLAPAPGEGIEEDEDDDNEKERNSKAETGRTKSCTTVPIHRPPGTTTTPRPATRKHHTPAHVGVSRRRARLLLVGVGHHDHRDCRNAALPHRTPPPAAATAAATPRRSPPAPKRYTHHTQREDLETRPHPGRPSQVTTWGRRLPRRTQSSSQTWWRAETATPRRSSPERSARPKLRTGDTGNEEQGQVVDERPWRFVQRPPPTPTPPATSCPSSDDDPTGLAVPVEKHSISIGVFGARERGADEMGVGRRRRRIDVHSETDPPPSKEHKRRREGREEGMGASPSAYGEPA
ncbi:hypothetical protein C8R46DRAFT_1218968 [Mycena filopes]|nr:hypothetical protein C8R46DRAFT_1218968 [Mycena filopes]